jgi:hypothetical protein
MSNLVIPANVAAAFASNGTFEAVYTKPAGATSATVFVAGKGADLTSVSKATATATLSNGVLHVGLGSGAAARSAAGLASEEVVKSAALAHGITAVTSISHG